MVSRVIKGNERSISILRRSGRRIWQEERWGVDILVCSPEDVVEILHRINNGDVASFRISKHGQEARKAGKRKIGVVL